MNRFRPILVNVGTEVQKRCPYWIPWELSLQPGSVRGSIRRVCKDKQEEKSQGVIPSHDKKLFWMTNYETVRDCKLD